jgi:hypothetical protein
LETLTKTVGFVCLMLALAACAKAPEGARAMVPVTVDLAYNTDGDWHDRGKIAARYSPGVFP